MAGRRWLEAWGDWLAAAALTVLVQVELWSSAGPDADEVPVAAVSAPLAALADLAFTVSLVWRRRAPLGVLCLAALALAVAPTASLDASLALTAAVMLATYSAGAHTRGRRAVLAGLGVAGLILLSVLRISVGVEEPSDVAMPLALLGGPWLVGLAIRERRDREVALEERAALVERGRQEQVRAAAAEERTRIAREMHDIVAHAVTVIVLQARGGRRALESDPGATRAALDAIETTGSGALAEMRGVLGRLGDGTAAPLAPQPGLAGLDGLVAQLAQAGLHVDVDVEGPATTLPPTVDRAAYRILQEALTNVLKHAGVDRASIRLAYRPDELELDVRDAGRAAGGSDEGRGIAGMRARAAALGGTLVAGPRPGGGYTVVAHLPLATLAP